MTCVLDVFVLAWTLGMASFKLPTPTRILVLAIGWSLPTIIADLPGIIYGHGLVDIDWALLGNGIDTNVIMGVELAFIGALHQLTRLDSAKVRFGQSFVMMEARVLICHVSIYIRQMLSKTHWTAALVGVVLFRCAKEVVFQ